MSEQMTIGVTAEKQVGSVKRINFSLTKVVDVDAAHLIETILEAGLSDEEIDLYDSALIVETEFLIIKSDQPLTVRLGLVTNTPIEVEDLLVVTDSATKFFVSVPGSTNANVEIIYGGKTA